MSDYVSTVLPTPTWSTSKSHPGDHKQVGGQRVALLVLGDDHGTGPGKDGRCALDHVPCRPCQRDGGFVGHLLDKRAVGSPEDHLGDRRVGLGDEGFRHPVP